MSMLPFSHEEYKQILKAFNYKFDKYRLGMAQSFTILRHDVEFSVIRALDIAEIESELGVQSTFFFQVKSSAYNPFSVGNFKSIHRILELGHDVGLHFYVSHIDMYDEPSLMRELDIQRKLFEIGLSIDCSKFSYHRPPRWVLENRSDTVGDLINAYGESYFEFSPAPSKIKYIADSKHKWSYGHPLDHLNKKKVQILIHPDEWSVSGEKQEQQFFSDLITEHRKVFINTLDQETTHFSEHKGAFF